ncbi:MAG: hypothetical protein O7E52_14760 [Candidatus Poribacteria bacterium]|nr:hypothetical protein [Candidatus Poribacteria bacterium]
MRYKRMVTVRDATWRTWWGSRTDVCPYSPGDYYRPSPGLVGMTGSGGLCGTPA